MASNGWQSTILVSEHPARLVFCIHDDTLSSPLHIPQSCNSSVSKRPSGLEALLDQMKRKMMADGNLVEVTYQVHLYCKVLKIMLQKPYTYFYFQNVKQVGGERRLHSSHVPVLCECIKRCNVYERCQLTGSSSCSSTIFFSDYPARLPSCVYADTIFSHLHAPRSFNSSVNKRTSGLDALLDLLADEAQLYG